MGLVLGAILGVVAASPAPDDIGKALDGVLDAEYQTELPGAEGPTRPATASTSGWTRRTQAPGRPQIRNNRQGQSREPRSFGSIAQILIWVLIAVIALILVMWAAQRLWGYADDPSIESEVELDARPGVRLAAAVRPLGDAEALAQQGRFDAAIHTLLLRTLQELARGLPAGVPRSFTSREILAQVSMPGPARDALTELVGAVELCHFGDREPGRADYERCRGHFERFARAYLSGAAAPAGQVAGPTRAESTAGGAA